ncbi:MAG: DEAD/DEAH box helicase [bacterium]|nr:DEAD/DEAH box helicase [bacterium]
MNVLTRDEIKKLTANETTYLRGARYYKSQAVTNVRWSKASQQYFAIVKGSNDYNVSVTLEDGKVANHSCNCAGHAKHTGPCKHVVALLLFIADYYEQKTAKKPNTSEDMAAYRILQYFEKQDFLTTYGEVYDIEVTVRIPNLLRNDESRVYVQLSAGAGRQYKIQNVRKFLSEYMRKETIVLGKEFKFIHGESTFTKESQAILDFFLEIYEVQEVLGSSLSNLIFQKNMVALSKHMFFKLLEQLDEQPFNIQVYNNELERARYVKGNPVIKLGLITDENSIQLEDKENANIIPLTDKGELMLVDNVLYRPNRKFISNYLPFYSIFGKQDKPLVFHNESKDKFLSMVLPKIFETMELDIPSELQDKYIVADLKPSIYLDKHKANVRATVKFQYGEYEINPLDYVAKDGLIIVRQPEKESAIISLLEDMHFVPSCNYYALRDERYIFEFLTIGVTELSDTCDLYYSDDFKNFTLRNPGKLTTALKVNNEINMLEMEFNYEEIPKDELHALFQSLQLKKKYHRLKNGAFISLEDENFASINDIFDKLDVDEENIGENGLMLPKNSAVYVNNILEEGKDYFIEKNEEFVELVNGIVEPSTTNFELPDGIEVSLRPYQVTGYKWLRTLAKNGLGGILADDMGLGKTLQTIVYITSCIEEMEASGSEKMPFLIICPTSLVYNWQDEFHNFAPHIRTVVVSGSPEIRKELIETHVDNDVIITSYPLIRRDIEHYEAVKIHTMFIDEAQFIKNANSISAKVVKQVRAKYRFALTGTPIENSLSELWSIFDFIMPYYLFSHAKFAERYEKPIIRENNQEVLEDLSRHIQPFILRRMKKDVLEELPEKIESKYLTDMTDEQRNIYLSYMESIRNDITKEINENGIAKSQMKILAALTRLRQICCHPSTFIDNYTGGSGKLDLLMDLLPDIILNGHRILIFSQFTSMLGLIEEELKKQNIGYFYLEGSTAMEDRQEYVKRFNDGEGSVFLISLKAGGTGLNLTGADTVIHFDPWWNPAVEEQATDRAYRIGQKNKVHVIKLLTKGSIEEKIYKLQQRKKALSEAVIQSKEVFINKLTREEIEDLFRD